MYAVPIGGGSGNPVVRLINLVFAVFLSSASAVVLSLEASEKVTVSPVLTTQETWIGEAIVYPEGEAEVTVIQVEIEPGGETGWHYHQVPSFGMLLEGELEVEFENGEVKTLTAGEAAAEAVNVLHNGRNVGEVTAKLVVFYTGATDKKLTVQASARN